MPLTNDYIDEQIADILEDELKLFDEGAHDSFADLERGIKDCKNALLALQAKIRGNNAGVPANNRTTGNNAIRDLINTIHGTIGWFQNRTDFTDNTEITYNPDSDVD